MTYRDDPRHLAGRQRLWNAAVERRQFTYFQLKDDTGMNLRSVQKHVREWERAGLVTFTGKLEVRRKIYKVSKSGARLATPRREPVEVGRQSPETNMWRAMRGLRTFSEIDLSAHATTEKVEVSPIAARKYCGVLVKTDYLKVRQTAIPGKRTAIYQLVNDTGPKAPQLKRVPVVIDDNDGEIRFVEEVRS